MPATLLWQYAVIALAVLGSALFVWKTRFPGSFRRVRVAIAVPLVRETRPDWVRRVGRWIAPPASKASSCDGCSSGCG